MFGADLDLSGGGAAAAAPPRRSQRRPSPSFDDDDDSDTQPARSQRRPSPSFDDDSSSGGEEETRPAAPAAAAARAAPPSLFQTGAGQGVQLSQASLRRGQELMRAAGDEAAARRDAGGQGAARRSLGAAQAGARRGEGLARRASGRSSGACGGSARRSQSAGPSELLQRAAQGQRTAVKRPASPTYDDDDDDDDDDDEGEGGAGGGGGGAAAARRVEPASSRPLALARPPSGAAAPAQRAAPALHVRRQSQPCAPPGQLPAKRRRRTRVLSPNASQQRDGPAQAAPASAARQRYLSRRMQDDPPAAPLSALATRGGLVRRQVSAQCAEVLQVSGRSTTFFDRKPVDLLADLIRAGADGKLVDEAWVKNHSRWIVWKLAGYAQWLPSKNLLPDEPCGFSVASLREQLLYRYDVEKGQGKRSALRKIMDGDAGPSRPMVLCVASVCSPCAEHAGYKLEVTDGWWPASALLDNTLSGHAASGKISVGDKLWLVGASVAKASKTELKPVEGELTLAFHANGTRKASFHTRLGLQRMSPRSFVLPICTLRPDAGRVCCMDVVVQRVYQTLYREQMKDGRFVFRDSRAEAAASKSHQTRIETKREEIMASFIRKHEVQKEQAMRSGLSTFSRGVDNLDNDELYAAVAASSDPHAASRSLSNDQRRRLHRAMDQQQEALHTEMQAALEEDTPNRNVSALFRVHLTDAAAAAAASPTSHFSNSPNSCVMTVWRDNEDGLFAEGRRLRIFNVHGATRSTGIACFNFRRDSQIETVPSVGARWPSFVARSPVSLASLSGCGVGSQIDFCGVLLSLSGPATEIARSKGRVYLLDQTKSVACLQLWKFQDMRTPGVAKGASRRTAMIVEVRDGFYGGRDPWSSGTHTHLAYCTEDTAVSLRNVSRAAGRPRAESCVNHDLADWLTSPAAPNIVSIVEDQVSACLEAAQPLVMTSPLADSDNALSAPASRIVEHASVEFTGLLAEKCQAGSLEAAEKAIDAKGTDSRRLTLPAGDNSEARSLAGLAQVCISEDGERERVLAVLDRDMALLLLRASGASSEPASVLLTPRSQRPEGSMDRMVWRLVRDGICGSAGSGSVAYLPGAAFGSGTGTPQLRGQLALHRAQTLQRRVAVRQPSQRCTF